VYLLVSEQYREINSLHKNRGARSSERLNFVGPHYGNCLMLPFWRLLVEAYPRFLEGLCSSDVLDVIMCAIIGR